VQGLSYEVRRGRKESGVRIAKPSMVCVVKSFKRSNVCIMYGWMDAGCDERLISLGWAPVGWISKLKWGKRGVCKCSIGGRRK
jgi:hypothetical protein